MDELLDKSTLRLVVAQICVSLGWHSVTRFTLEILTDIIEKYLKKISVTVAGFCQNDGRQSPTVHDVGFVFDNLGISCLELEDYLHQVEQAPFCRTIPDHPVAKPFELKHSDVDVDYYEPHFPPLVKIEVEKEKEAPQEEEVAPVESTDVPVDEVEQDGKTKRPLTLTRKRSYDSPPYSPIEPKRLNLDAQEHVMDLTRPDLKVSTPKELAADVAPVERSGSISRPDLHVERSRTDKARLQVEKSDSLGKGKESTFVDRKDSHKKENVSKPLVLSSPPAERPSKEKIIGNTPPKTPDVDKRSVLSSPKLPPEKSDRSPFALMPPFGHSINVSPSPPKHKTSASPKISKNITSPKTPEIPKKSSAQLKLDSSSEVLPTKAFDSTISPIYSPPKSKDKNTHAAKTGKKVSEVTKEKKKKKKKLMTPKSEEKVTAPVKLKISSFKELKEPKVVKKKKASAAPKDAATLMSSEIAESSEKLTVPKLVFKPLAYPPATLKPSESNSKDPIKKSAEKKKIKSSDGKDTSGVKKKPKISVSDVKLKKKDSTVKLKDSKGKVKSKTSKSLKVKDQRTKGVVPVEAKEQPGDGIMNCKFESSAEDGIKMLFTSPLIKPFTSPTKKLASPLGSPPSMPSMPAVTPHVDYEPPKKKVKPEKKKKNTEKQEATEVSKSKVPKKSKKDVKKDPDGKPPKAKKTKKEPLTPAIIQPIPKLTLKMDPTSASTPSTNTSSKVVIKPLPSPTKSTDSVPSKKSKTQSSTVSKAPLSAVGGGTPSSKKSAGAAISTPAPPPPPSQPIVVGPGQPIAGDVPSHRGVFTVTLATTNVATAEVYYCPACQRPDDGSPMIGCDGCDLWYHWPCVGVFYAPKDDEQWFCPPCTDKQKKKKKKKKDG